MKVLNFELVSVGDAARYYGVSVATMRRWDRQGKLTSHSRTLGNHRRYKLNENYRVKVGYARVSSHDQKKDLVTQSAYLSPFCDMVLEDLGSGLNCKKPRLRKLILMLLNKEVSELHLSHKESEVATFEQELCKDVITLMTVFSARMYGRRSHQNNKIKQAA